MFEHTQEAFGKFIVHKIQDPVSQTGFDLVPGYGANVLDIRFGGVSVIDGYRKPVELDLNNWGKSILLYPFPNRLKDGLYNWHGNTYQFPINDSYTGNALHGLGATQAMSVYKVLTSDKGGCISCQFKHDGSNEAYPFPFCFTVTFEITPQTFKGKLHFENTGEEPIPVGFGWHPYFSLSEKVDDSELQLPALEMIGINERMIPTGKRYPFDDFRSLKKIGATVLDNCFAFAEEDAPRLNLRLHGDKGRLDYWQEAGPGKFSFLQLFTPPARNAVAIEPMTCNVDAFNNGDGLIDLDPGTAAAAEFGFTFSPA